MILRHTKFGDVEEKDPYVLAGINHMCHKRAAGLQFSCRLSTSCLYSENTENAFPSAHTLQFHNQLNLTNFD
jgi:hypothetical protein